MDLLGGLKKIKPTQTEDNVIKLDPSKKEPKIFEEKTEKNNQDEPLDKIKKMEESGIIVAKSPSIIGKTLFNKLSN